MDPNEKTFPLAQLDRVINGYRKGLMEAENLSNRDKFPVGRSSAGRTIPSSQQVVARSTTWTPHPPFSRRDGGGCGKTRAPR
jgi:hypothetical protein